MLSLPEEPRILKLLHPMHELLRQVLRRPRVLRKVRRTSRLEITSGAVDLLAVLEHDPGRAPAASPAPALTGASQRIVPPLASKRLAERIADRAHAAARESPGADRIVDVAHVMMQQHVGGARASAGPSAVPMIELPAKCALTISLSKYSSRKSAALMVQNRSVSYMRSSPRPWKRWPRYSSSLRSRELERGRIGRLAQQQRLDELALAHHVARDSGRRPPHRACECREISRRSASWLS